MILYEVNLFIQPQIQEKYRVWLKKHIQEILTLPGFIEAKVFEVKTAKLTGERDGKNKDTLNLTVHYYLESKKDLEAYLNQHAPRLREEGLRLFPNQFTAQRRVLEELVP